MPPSDANASDWAAVWTVVFAANAPLPVGFGTLLCRDAADWAGLAGGLLLLWGAGLAVTFAGRPVRDAFLRGAVAVALSQFVPCLHLLAGVAAVAGWRAVAGPAVPPGVGVFAVAVLTGAPLLAAAGGVGAAVTAWDDYWDRERHRRVYGADPADPEGDG